MASPLQMLRLLSIVVFLTSVAKLNAADLQPSDITDLVLVTGQSNVTGSQTGFDPGLDAVDSRIFAYTSKGDWEVADLHQAWDCLLYTSPSPRDRQKSRMPSSA